MNTTAWKGRHNPLGAQVTPQGVNFALFSEHASGVEVCLFDKDGKPTQTIPLHERRDHVWHGFIPGLKAGQLYGYRVDGPYEPEKGFRFNKHKLLIDPYARAVAGSVSWGPEVFGYIVGHKDADLSFDERDSAPQMPKSVVVDSSFDWSGDKRPDVPLPETIVYETHIKGFSQLWESVPQALRGTYAGLGTPQAIEYFKALGVTSVELLPIHHHVDSDRLLNLKLSDYWGYNNIGYFAPEGRYSSDKAVGAEVNEFKAMVKALHAAGLEVILDVVYNHTAEGNELGPTLCFKGVDATSYYRLVPDAPRHFFDFTGTGNTLNLPHPRTLQLVMDSLRYWVEEMHVDGFRFDLAPTLARGDKDVNPRGPFFQAIHQDPVLSRVKLIAEPWDVGDGGFQVGKFPPPWTEWNGLYRDTVRRFWKGDTGLNQEFALRFLGSADLYQANGRAPFDSVNFVTAHDGFSLQDLVSFAEKHNEANGEDNKDGDNNNNSWNWGHEGLDAPEEVRALRRKMLRNFLATLLLSQGIPMIRAGDEFAATQRGNNNAYCQDNEISWLDWKAAKGEEGLLRFVRKLISLRREHPVFRQTRFLGEATMADGKTKALRWIGPDAAELTPESFSTEKTPAFGCVLRGNGLAAADHTGAPVNDATYLVLFNPHHEDVAFLLPDDAAQLWQAVLQTSDENGFLEPEKGLSGGSDYKVPSRSLVVFQATGKS